MEDSVLSMLAQDSNTLWVFAYGSLLWKPCFHYNRSMVGHIKGFKRRFFQGNTNLRGSVSQPGRVAILVPDEEEVTWGVAYEILGQQHVQDAVEHLYVRENANGGYHSMLTTFHPRPPAHDVSDPDDDLTVTSHPFSIVCFTATSSSHLYMGPADVNTMAQQVVAAKGQAGPNSEYVLRTAEYVREHIPEDHDPHLFSLEIRVRELLDDLQHRRSSGHCDLASTNPTLHTLTVPV